jgi:hypothetical protein
MNNEDKRFDKKIYDKLIAAVDALPKEAVESTKKEITRKGYDTTGYQYQFLVNVLNEVVEPCNWSFEYKVIKELQGAWGSGKPFFDVTVETKIDILGTERTCVGGHKSESYADALKGAITNSLKKTLGLFGIGKKAYEGTIDDDYLPVPEGKLVTNKCCKCDRTDTRQITIKGQQWWVCPTHIPAE